jgi:hypothetical protein
MDVRHALNTYYVPGIILDIGDIVVNQIGNVPALEEFTVWPKKI